MDVEPFDIEDLEAEQTEVVDKRLHRVLRDVLVVDAVELVLLHELECMRYLDDEDAVVIEQERHPQRKRVEIADVMKRVRGDDDLRRAMLFADLSGELGVKYSVTTSMPRSRASSAMFLAGSTPSVRGAPAWRNERKSPSLQPMSTVSASLESRNRSRQRIGKTGEVTMHRVGRRRDVDVVAEVLGRNLIRHLDQTAIQTDVDIERETRFRLLELLGAQEPVRERVVAEREKEIEIVRSCRSGTSSSTELPCWFCGTGRAAKAREPPIHRRPKPVVERPSGRQPSGLRARRNPRRVPGCARRAVGRGQNGSARASPTTSATDQRELPHCRRPARADVVHRSAGARRSASARAKASAMSSTSLKSRIWSPWESSAGSPRESWRRGTGAGAMASRSGRRC